MKWASHGLCLHVPIVIVQCTQQLPEVLRPDLIFWNLCYCPLEAYRTAMLAASYQLWHRGCFVGPAVWYLCWRRTSLRAASASWRCHMTCTTQQHDVSRWPKETAMRSMRHLVSAACGCVSCRCKQPPQATQFPTRAVMMRSQQAMNAVQMHLW